MYNIAICDDEDIFSQKISSLVNQHLSLQNIVAKQKIYNNSGFLFEDIEGGQLYDIYILDIEMPWLSGTDVAKKSGSILLKQSSFLLHLICNIPWFPFNLGFSDISQNRT